MSLKWLEIKVIFEHNDSETAADLISQVFYAIGVKGVVIEDPFLEPPGGWGDSDTTRPEYHAVIGYLPCQTRLHKQCQMLQTKLALLQKKIGLQFWVGFSQMDEKDWSDSWKAHFKPEKIGQRLVVKPAWHPYEAASNDIVLEIDPGMAFGTGTHPTTRLCLNLIETFMKKGDSILDVGTGSGILMIAAAKLGGKKVFGIDNDPIALEVAEKNLKLNNIRPTQFRLISGNLVDPVDDRFDLVVANILIEAIMVLLDKIKKVLKGDGIFICSGISERHQNLVIDKMKFLDFEIIHIYSKQKWIAIAGKLK